MIGSIKVTARPIKLGFLIEPNDSKAVSKAMRLSTSLSGGLLNPIIFVNNKS
jgi:hypothetical protein